MGQAHLLLRWNSHLFGGFVGGEGTNKVFDRGSRLQRAGLTLALGLAAGGENRGRHETPRNPKKRDFIVAEFSLSHLLPMSILI